MADIPANSSLASAAPSGATATNIPVAVAAAIVSLPDSLAQLGRQLEVNATVMQSVTNNTLNLSTSLGTLTLSLADLAKTQQQVVVQQLLNLFDAQKPLSLIINPGTPPTQATIFVPTANASPPTSATANQVPLTPPSINGPALPIPASAANIPATNLTAIVLPNGITLPTNMRGDNVSTLFPPVAQTNNSPAIPTAAAQIQPLAAESALPIAPPAPTMPTNVMASPDGEAQPVPSITSLLQEGKEVALHIDAVIPAGSLPTQPASQNQLAATVIGSGTNGQLILKAGESTLFVRQNIDLPIGSNLLVTIEATKTDLPQPLPPAASNFPGMQQVFSALAEINPQLAQQVFTTQLPLANDSLPASLLFMMNALKQGAPNSWLGDEAINTLSQSGKFELLSKLAQETTASGQTIEDNIIGQWQSYPVPLYAQGQPQILSLYVHVNRDHDAKSDQDSRKVDFTRFVIDVTFSKIGPMQLDGFVQNKKLDMIVRTEHALPDGLAPDLRQSYRLAVESVGFAGSLGFQIGHRNWLVFRNNRAATAVVT